MLKQTIHWLKSLSFFICLIESISYTSFLSSKRAVIGNSIEYDTLAAGIQNDEKWML